MALRIHVACDHEIIRKSIAALLDTKDEFDVVRTSPEGARGVREVQATNCDVLVLAVPQSEDVVTHARWYRDALPDAGIVGFCVAEDQEVDYRQADINDVVFSYSTSDELAEAIGRVASQQ